MLGIICLVERVFWGHQTRYTVIGSCGLTGTLDLPRPGHTFALVVQICIVGGAFGGILSNCGTRGRPVPISSLSVSIAPITCVRLFSSSVGVTRSDIFKGAVTYSGQCIRY